MFQNHTPRLTQPIQRPRSIGGAGRGQTHGGNAGRGELPARVKRVGGCTVGENARDLRRCKERREIVRTHVFDACIGRAVNVAGGGGVPQCHMILQQERALLGNCHGHGTVENGGGHAPEAVLRMSVEKAALPRLHRGERAEDKHG